MSSRPVLMCPLWWRRCFTSHEELMNATSTSSSRMPHHQLLLLPREAGTRTSRGREGR